MLSGKLSGASCLKILVLLSDAPQLFRELFGAVRAILSALCPLWRLICCIDPGLDWKLPLESAPTEIFQHVYPLGKENQVSLPQVFLSHPASERRMT